MKLNLHTHTWRCNHATGVERDYVEAAVREGYTTLGFSDHAPMPFPGDFYSNWRMRVDQFPGYVETLLALREEFGDRINLLIGLEAEYYPLLFRDFLKLVCRYPLDYLILGQHMLDNEYDTHLSCTMGTADEGVLASFIDQTMEGMDTGMFTYVCHPDAFVYSGSPESYARQMRRLCRHSRETGIPLEINLLGLWDHRNYPCEPFFRIAGEEGCRVVLGMDAHQPTRFAIHETIREAEAFAARCGVSLTEDISLRKPHVL